MNMAGPRQGRVHPNAQVAKLAYLGNRIRSQLKSERGNAVHAVDVNGLAF